jgi:succinate dehydrogenase/fumarate reductase flavoprotein subunit
VDKPDRKYGDIMPEVNKLVAEQYTRAGKGPVFMDCTGISDEDYEYMMHWMQNEGNAAILGHMQAEGIDFRKNPIEFMTYQMRAEGKILANTHTETTLKGLFAAGDETVGGIAPAATFGWIGGEQAAGYSEKAGIPDIRQAETKIEEARQLIDRMRGRENGPDWQEVNIALQQTMFDYAGAVRYKKLLEQGRSRLGRLKEKACNTMMAPNPHELGRCLEVLNLLDIGEMVFITAEDRKETRGLHVRPDYPYTNPVLNAFHLIKKINGKTITEWIEPGQ